MLWRDYVERMRSSKDSVVKKRVDLIVTLLRAFLTSLSNFEFLYQTLYLLFAILGIFSSYIFFLFHLTDFMRIDLLKSIVSAIWIRKIPLLLTFLLFLLFEYYFTLIGYTLFYEQYPNQRCNNLYECFFETFDL